MDSQAATAFQNKLYLCSIALASIGCVFWTFFNFLAAEDATVLFNRTNHLSNSPIFIFYAGYISAFPQLVAFSVRCLPGVLQACIYSLISLIVFSILLRYLYLITCSGLATLLLVTICAIFHPAPLYNLTSTLWSGVAILGLLGMQKAIAKVPIYWKDVLLCLPGLFGSPLAIAFFPLYLRTVTTTTKVMPPLFITLGTLFSYLLLTNHSSTRADTANLLNALAGNLKRFELTHLVNTDSIADFAMSLLGIISLVITLAAGAYLVIFKRRNDTHTVVLFLLGSSATLIAAFSASSIPLQARYWFPTIISGVVVAFTIIRLNRWTNALKNLQSLFAVSLLLAVTLTFAARTHHWGGFHAGQQDWLVLAGQNSGATAIIRERHADGGAWAIGVGNPELFFTDCKDTSEHPFSQKKYGFSVYCGENR